jgi:geranylgeranyl diphosphate synthase type I
MRTELVAGQYLDLVGQARAEADPRLAARAARYKTARYTVDGPLRIGGLLAGADDALLAAYRGYALPLGDAFQLRDDLLGAFGDPAVTGKPVGDDLRDGKCTSVLAAAMSGATGQRALRLRQLAGGGLDPRQTAELRDILLDSGAPDLVEDQITELVRTALTALRSTVIDEASGAALAELALAATARRR